MYLLSFRKLPYTSSIKTKETRPIWIRAILGIGKSDQDHVNLGDPPLLFKIVLILSSTNLKTLEVMPLKKKVRQWWTVPTIVLIYTKLIEKQSMNINEIHHKKKTKRTVTQKIPIGINSMK